MGLKVDGKRGAIRITIYNVPSFSSGLHRFV